MSIYKAMLFRRAIQERRPGLSFWQVHAKSKGLQYGRLAKLPPERVYTGKYCIGHIRHVPLDHYRTRTVVYFIAAYERVLVQRKVMKWIGKGFEVPLRLHLGCDIVSKRQIEGIAFGESKTEQKARLRELAGCRENMRVV